MPNIIDYIKWRGELSFKDSKFNEIDNLICAAISYLPFDKIIKEREKITIKEAFERYLQEEKRFLFNSMQKEEQDFFSILARSKRFGDLYITEYENKFDEKEEKQFAAITIIFPDNTIYVSYRGTDNTLVGWKEDFNMSFMEFVPAQTDATNYLEKIARKTFAKIRVGGHSKGGNLAIYASTFCNKRIQKRIIDIYNNDGPGFTEKVVESDEYKNILSKIHTYIPQSSVIGRLLEHKEKCIIIKSTENGIFQHNLYSWQVEGTHFIYIDELTGDSEFIDKTIKDWLKNVEPKQREKFVDILYKIISETGAKTLNELSTNWVENAKIFIKSYRDIEPQEKLIVLGTIHSLIKIARSNFKNKL